MEESTQMSWNPSVRAAPVYATSRSAASVEEARRRDMEYAAAAGVAMALAQRERARSFDSNSRLDGQASAWVVKGRIEMSNRWPV